MMKRINIIADFEKQWRSIKAILVAFPALKYLFVLVFAILSIFSLSNSWGSFSVLIILSFLSYRSKPLFIFLLVVTAYLWGVKINIDRIRLANYPVGRQTICIRLTDLKVVDPKLLSCRSVSYRAEVVAAPVNFPTRLMVNFYNPPSLHRGDLLQVTGKLVTSSVRIPGGFDYFEYLARKQIGGVFYVKTVESQESHFSWFAPIEWLRNRVLQTLTKGYDYGSAPWRIVSGVVVGEKRNLTYEDRQKFMVGGVFHIFAVSGMHVAIVALLVFYLLGFLRVPYRLKLLISPVVLLIYVLLTGASASSLRAFGMVTIWWVGQFLFRTSNLYYLLAICALIQLLFSPLLIYDAGFQFSFVIVFFLIRGMEVRKRIKSFLWVEQQLGVPKSMSFLNKLASISFDLLYVGLLVFIVAFGLQVYYFKLIQPFTILTAVWSGFCAAGIIFFSMLKLILPYAVINSGIDFFVIPLNSFSELIFSQDYYILVNETGFQFVLLYYLLLAGAFFIKRVWILFVLVMIFWSFTLLQGSTSTEVYYANVKGSRIIACIDPVSQSADVYVNGRSTQSALARLLSVKRVKKISMLWVGNDYTPTWQLENRFPIHSKQQVKSFPIVMHGSGIDVSIESDQFSPMIESEEGYNIRWREISPNEFHLLVH